MNSAHEGTSKISGVKSLGPVPSIQTSLNLWDRSHAAGKFFDKNR